MATLSNPKGGCHQVLSPVMGQVSSLSDREKGAVLKSGPYIVRNVGPSDEKNAKYWSECTGINLFYQKCGICGCDANAEVGGRVWVKNISELRYIMPMCRMHNKDPHLDHVETKEKVYLVACSVERMEKSGKKLDGHRAKEVSKVLFYLGDGGDEADYWSEHTKKRLLSEKCGIYRCNNNATLGKHVWLKGMDICCYIMPMCEEHRMDNDLNNPHFKDCKDTADLVRYEINGDMLPYTTAI